MAITRTAWTDDDGSGTTGTVINNTEKTSLYDQIDGRWSEATTTSTGNQDNFTYSEADVLRGNNATALTLRGLLAPASPVKPGKRLVIYSVGAGTVVLNDQDTNSSAANRIVTGTGAALTLAAGTGWAVLVYDATTTNGRWRVLASAVQAAAAGTLTGSTLAAGVTASSLTSVGTLTSLAIAGLLDLSGASAGQIKFPAAQNASSNVNTLDDYEEGNFVIVLGGSGGTSGQTYSARNGTYVKNGQGVLLGYSLTLSAKGTITTNAQLQGFPFALNSDTTFAVGAIGWFDLNTSWVSIIPMMSSSTVADLVGATAAATGNVATNLTTADIKDTTQIRGSISYKAAA